MMINYRVARYRIRRPYKAVFWGTDKFPDSGGFVSRTVNVLRPRTRATF
jgi:hypothetical protein